RSAGRLGSTLLLLTRREKERAGGRRGRAPLQLLAPDSDAASATGPNPTEPHAAVVARAGEGAGSQARAADGLSRPWGVQASLCTIDLAFSIHARGNP
ncbi:unnamed protein product, partial [Urochloa humidicola]